MNTPAYDPTGLPRPKPPADGSQTHTTHTSQSAAVAQTDTTIAWKTRIQTPGKSRSSVNHKQLVLLGTRESRLKETRRPEDTRREVSSQQINLSESQETPTGSGQKVERDAHTHHNFVLPS
ncbi:hypothetical protein DPX16_1449 [Anabarilius grahami]|uniref:Uncharacterized protein n=1 Tax=Anabarilius grahami TaxID=495550 RepID=A0A3N0YKM5_ANAGA|nr:hypothetical protein DPX16_1449 [Anabarilius grahami]